MTKFNDLTPGCVFQVKGDFYSTLYKLNADGSVSGEGAITMTPEYARTVFANFDLIIVNNPTNGS